MIEKKFKKKKKNVFRVITLAQFTEALQAVAQPRQAICRKYVLYDRLPTLRVYRVYTLFFDLTAQFKHVLYRSVSTVTYTTHARTRAAQNIISSVHGSIHCCGSLMKRVSCAHLGLYL